MELWADLDGKTIPKMSKGILLPACSSGDIATQGLLQGYLEKATGVGRGQTCDQSANHWAWALSWLLDVEVDCFVVGLVFIKPSHSFQQDGPLQLERSADCHHVTDDALSINPQEATLAFLSHSHLGGTLLMLPLGFLSTSRHVLHHSLPSQSVALVWISNPPPHSCSLATYSYWLCSHCAEKW